MNCHPDLGDDERPFRVLRHHVLLLGSEGRLGEAGVEAGDVSPVLCLVHVAVRTQQAVLADLGVVLQAAFPVVVHSGKQVDVLSHGGRETRKAEKRKRKMFRLGLVEAPCVQLLMSSFSLS